AGRTRRTSPRTATASRRHPRWSRTRPPAASPRPPLSPAAATPSPTPRATSPAPSPSAAAERRTRPSGAATKNRHGRGPPPRAGLLDASGRPIEGVSVTFTLPSASGAGASFLGGSNDATVATDSNGLAASPPLVANDTPGGFTATATVAGGGDPVTYRLRNV